MRTIRDPQMKFGEVDVAAIELDLKSRDDIPPILSSLQYIYATPALRASVFKVPERVIPSRSGSGLSNEDRHRQSGPPSWSSRDGAVEDSGAWRTAPGSQQRLRPHP